MAGTSPVDPQRRRCVWLRVLLLIAWFTVSFGAAFFARDLAFSIGGWPFNYWLAAQGGVLAFLAIVAIHAVAMRHIDPESEPPDWPEEDDE